MKTDTDTATATKTARKPRAKKPATKTSRKKVATVASRGPGRPPVELNFNFGNKGFTVRDVRNRYAKSKTKLITGVAITQKLKKMIETGAEVDGKVMAIVGKKVGAGRGRPFLVYKLVTPAELAKVNAAAEAAETPATETPAAE